MSLAIAWGVPFQAVADLDDAVFITALQVLDDQAADGGSDIEEVG